MTVDHTEDEDTDLVHEGRRIFDLGPKTDSKPRQSSNIRAFHNQYSFNSETPVVDNQEASSSSFVAHNAPRGRLENGVYQPALQISRITSADYPGADRRN